VTDCPEVSSFIFQKERKRMEFIFAVMQK